MYEGCHVSLPGQTLKKDPLHPTGSATEASSRTDLGPLHQGPPGERQSLSPGAGRKLTSHLGSRCPHWRCFDAAHPRTSWRSESMTIGPCWSAPRKHAAAFASAFGHACMSASGA